ncbi:MAG: GNAT family N-acetyltransferase [Methylobacterium sp.]|nr:GNAT family N-acetyltransferase [Methylobacterium sp.]
MRKQPTLLFGHSDLVAQWVLEKIPDVQTFGKCEAIGVGNADTGRLYAGVVFHDYQPHFETISVSIAAVNPMWATRQTIKALLHYPFEQIGVNLVTAIMRSTNARSLKTNEAIGFKRDGILRHRFGQGVHAVTASMTRNEFRKLYGV